MFSLAKNIFISTSIFERDFAHRSVQRQPAALVGVSERLITN